MLDWALIEIQFPLLEHATSPHMEFSAYVELPDALNGIASDANLPVQGVAYSGGGSGQYDAVPVLAFPNADLDPIDYLTDTMHYYSLRVDLRTLPTNEIIRIGLYGYVRIYYIIGGLGTDDIYNGTIFASDFYGQVTKNFGEDNSNVSAFTSTTFDDLDTKLFLPMSIFDFGYDRLISSFPEIATLPYAYLAVGYGYPDMAVAFDADSTGGLHWVAEEPNAIPVTPDNNPNAFLIFDVNADPVTAYWSGSIEKTITTITSNPSLNGNPVTTFPSSPATNIDQALVVSFWSKAYYVPTWKFDNPRTGTIRALGVESPNPWTIFAFRGTDNDGAYTWEDPAIFPDRLELPEIGTATLPSQDASLANPYPVSHLGHQRIGTVFINRLTGAITFGEDPVEPTNGAPNGDGPDGPPPGRTANPQLRVWTFSLDEHDFYILRLGDSLTLVYDAYSDEWMDWTDSDASTWRAHCGFNWVGAEQLANTYGSNAIVGDDLYGLLWFLDPNQPFDDDPLGTDVSTYFPRVTVGQVPISGRENFPCYALWLTADMGAPAYSGAVVTLWMSDDAGKTWDAYDSIAITPNENSPELTWYSLGQIEAPGRLFKIFDDGAIARIDGLKMNDPDDKNGG